MSFKVRASRFVLRNVIASTKFFPAKASAIKSAMPPATKAESSAYADSVSSKRPTISSSSGELPRRGRALNLGHDNACPSNSNPRSAKCREIISRRKICGTIEKVWGSLSESIRCVVQTRSVRRHERGRFESELYQRAKRFRKRCPTFGNRS